MMVLRVICRTICTTITPYINKLHKINQLKKKPYDFLLRIHKASIQEIISEIVNL